MWNFIFLRYFCYYILFKWLFISHSSCFAGLMLFWPDWSFLLSDGQFRWVVTHQAELLGLRYDSCYQATGVARGLGDKTHTSLIGQQWAKTQISVLFWNPQRILCGLIKSSMPWVWGGFALSIGLVPRESRPIYTKPIWLWFPQLFRNQ